MTHLTFTLNNWMSELKNLKSKCMCPAEKTDQAGSGINPGLISYVHIVSHVMTRDL